MRRNPENLAAVERERERERERATLLKTEALLNALKNRINNKNKDPCYGLRLLYLRI